MSAKWRRSKKSSRRFNFFRAFSRNKERKDLEPLRIKSPRMKSQMRPRTYGVQKFSADRKLRDPEPLIDVVEQNDEIAVVAEFARFDREKLRIHVKNQRLTLSAETLDRKYHKSLNLPKRVIPNTIRTTYKNGVLEIRLKKVVEEKTIDGVAG